MSDTALQRKIASAAELGSVVRTMKAMSASNIGQYENAVLALNDYYKTVQLGLIACLRQRQLPAIPGDIKTLGALVFGSDQGLVGQFNEDMVMFVEKTLAELPGEKEVWSVGERIGSRLSDRKISPVKCFGLPGSINAITSLVVQVLTQIELQREGGKTQGIFIFFSRPGSGAIYTPVCQQIWPLDDVWQRELTALKWPTKYLPELIDCADQMLAALISEYLFVSIFRACVESLASENASRLASMQRAEKNIEELSETLKLNFHSLRQRGIDEELFDVISGFEALSPLI